MICFMDTETLGLHVEAPVWEFAAIWIHGNIEDQLHLFIEHEPEPWLSGLPKRFHNDYLKRYNRKIAVDEPIAAKRIRDFTEGAHIVGAVPSFDTERLAVMLRRHGYEPRWHYHLIDIENVTVGYLRGKGETLIPPWSSDDISRRLGIDPDNYQRHTAMGDVRWVRAQWDLIMGEMK